MRPHGALPRPRAARPGRRRGGPRCGCGSPGGRSARRRRRASWPTSSRWPSAWRSARAPGGTSLDNTVRIVLDEPTDDWILLDIEAEGMNRSIGCGRVRLWRRDGTLIGVGTQSGDRPHEPPPDLRAGTARVACTTCASPRSTTSSSTSPTPRQSVAWWHDLLGLEPVRLDEWRRGEVPFVSVRINDGTILDLFVRRAQRARTSTTWRSRSPTSTSTSWSRPGRSTSSAVRSTLFGAMGQGHGLYVRDPTATSSSCAPTLPEPTARGIDGLVHGQARRRHRWWHRHGSRADAPTRRRGMPRRHLRRVGHQHGRHAGGVRERGARRRTCHVVRRRRVERGRPARLPRPRRRRPTTPITSTCCSTTPASAAAAAS